MTEEWKSIPGYEGYFEVSSLGRVRSIARTVKVTRANGTVYDRAYKPRLRRLSLTATGKTSDGYLSVSLGKDGRGVSREVHSLVALAFIGPRPIGKHVCHRDGNGLNNRPSNLYYGTPAQNAEDGRRMGRLAGTKLSEAHAREVIAAYGQNVGELAAKYGVSKAAIYNAQVGNTWKHLHEGITQ